MGREARTPRNYDVRLSYTYGQVVCGLSATAKVCKKNLRGTREVQPTNWTPTGTYTAAEQLQTMTRCFPIFLYTQWQAMLSLSGKSPDIM